MAVSQIQCPLLAVFLRALWAGPPCFVFIFLVWRGFCIVILSITIYMQMTSNYVFPLKPNQSDAVGAIRNLEACIKDVAVWMNSHSLKLNNKKTEFVLFGSKVNLSKIDINSIVIPDTVIGVSDSCRNLGVMLDSTMTMSTQISSICKSIWYQLRNLHCKSVV